MANNTYTKNYLDTQALTEAKLDAAFQSLQMDLAQSAQLTTGATAGQVLTVSSGGAAAVWATAADPEGPFMVRNYGLSASTSSGSLIVALKTAAGTNPTASDIVDVVFSSNGSSSAVPNKFQQTASLTLSVTASATLGVRTATTATLYVYAVRVSSSSLRLAISTDGSFDYGAAQATTLMASSADTPGVLYSNAAASTYPVRLLGWITASHTTGSWNAIYKVNLVNGLNDPTGIANRRVRSALSVSTSAITVLAGGVAISNSSGTFNSSSSTYVDVTNLSVTITTTGRPIFIGLISDGTGTNHYATLQAIGTVDADNGAGAYFNICRDGTEIATTLVATTCKVASNGVRAIYVPAGALTHIDTSAAGTYTFKVQTKRSTTGAGSALCYYAKLVAYEL